MPSRAASCEGKKRYDTYAGAQVAINRARKRPKRGERRKPLEAYRCYLCQGWHVGGRDSLAGEISKRDREWARHMNRKPLT